MHKATQKRFFELVTDQQPLYAALNNPIQTYKELIHYRFKEVVFNTFARFFDHIDEAILDSLVRDFIKSGPKSPYIWKMPDAFRRFIVKRPFAKSYPYLEELLWFEWIEVELYMGNFSHDAGAVFDWEVSWKLSSSARKRKLSYAIFDDARIEEHGEFALLVYYDFAMHEVRFQEITPFMLGFLEILETMSAQEALEHISKVYEVAPAEVKPLLQEPMESFCALGILIKE